VVHLNDETSNLDDDKLWLVFLVNDETSNLCSG